MLTSAVFSFRGLPRPPYRRGEVAYRWVLRAIRQVDAPLAAALHDGTMPGAEGPRYKPLTVSCVTRGDVNLLPSTSRIRATALTEDVTRALEWLRTCRTFEPIGDNPAVPVRMEIERYAGGAAARSYAAIAASAASRAEGRPRAVLRFMSPTAFAAGANAVSLFPEPGLVFGSLIRRWNQHAGPALTIGTQVCESLLGACRVESHSLRTGSVLAAGRVSKGFFGECEFSMPEETSRTVREAFYCLAEFAFFSGVGMRTAMGMGQVREVKR